MSKVFSLPKNFKRFRATDKQILLMLQWFTFGVFNTRLKLKKRGYQFRQTDIVPILVVGELRETGCKVSDLRNILGYNNSLAQNILTRCVYRKLLHKYGGRKGRGNASKYYLTDYGFKVYETLQTEMGKSFHEATRQLYHKVVTKLS
jgi:DNA-binding MarR family transcriptional regulator